MNTLRLLILLISLLIALTEGGVTQDHCLKDAGWSKEELKEEKKKSSPSLKLRCYYRCFLEKDELIANNAIIPGAFKQKLGTMLSPEKIAEVESLCHTRIVYSKDKMPSCNFAYVMYSCYNALTKGELNRPQITDY